MANVTDCGVCDGTTVAVLGTGSRTEFHDCPACVGLDPESLTGEEKEDAIAACHAEGVAPIWKPTRRTP